MRWSWLLLLLAGLAIFSCSQNQEQKYISMQRQADLAFEQGDYQKAALLWQEIINREAVQAECTICKDSDQAWCSSQGQRSISKSP